MNATTKFYIGFAIALALVVGASFTVGYRFGLAHVAVHAQRNR